MVAIIVVLESQSMRCLTLEIFIIVICNKEYLFLILKCISVGKYQTVLEPCKQEKCRQAMIQDS